MAARVKKWPSLLRHWKWNDERVSLRNEVYNIWNLQDQIVDGMKWEITTYPFPENIRWIRALGDTRHFSFSEIGRRVVVRNQVLGFLQLTWSQSHWS